MGTVFTRTSFIIETPIDLDGDGTFSNDLFEEINFQFNCENVIRFGQFGNLEDNEVFNPRFTFLGLTVNNVNDNLTQSFICGSIDGQGIILNYDQEGDIISFTNISEEFIGTLSKDRSSITFKFPNESLFGISPEAGFFRGNDILREDGTVEEYTGGATVIYTRIQYLHILYPLPSIYRCFLAKEILYLYFFFKKNSGIYFYIFKGKNNF